MLDTVRNRKKIGTRTHGRGVSLLGGRCSSSTFIVTCLQRRLGDRVRLFDCSIAIFVLTSCRTDERPPGEEEGNHVR